MKPDAAQIPELLYVSNFVLLLHEGELTRAKIFVTSVTES